MRGNYTDLQAEAVRQLVKERINNFQLFTLILIFQIGSTTLFALGIDAKQDAWMAVLIALAAGWAIIWMYTEIQKQFPDQNLAEILISVLGKWLAAPLILLYALHFFYISSFNLYEFSEFLIQSFLDDTPLLAVLLMTSALVLYSMFLGIEVIARSGELVLPYLLLFIVATYVFVGLSGEVKLEQLTPVLENGIAPVLKTAPQLVTFPFGEMIVFLMYWKYVNNKQAIRKTSLIAVTVAGLLLAASLITMISVLGVKLTSIQSIPLFRVIKHISVGEFIQRLDVIGGTLLFLGGFYKMTLYFNASRLALGTLFGLKRQRWLMIVMAVLWIWFIRVYFKNFTFYRWVGSTIINPHLEIPVQFLIPFLLLIIIKVKKKLQAGTNSNTRR